MEILIKPLSGRDIDKAAGMLSETFADDKGVQVLFPEGDTAYFPPLKEPFSMTKTGEIF